MDLDEEQKRLTIKAVYYGSAMSGKTTNLLRLHDCLKPERRGDLVTLDTTEDRALFFDLLPFFLVAPSGLRIKTKVYTVPGQVRYYATRKAVLYSSLNLSRCEKMRQWYMIVIGAQGVTGMTVAEYGKLAEFRSRLRRYQQVETGAE